MDGSQQPTSGFPLHLQEQLNQAAAKVSPPQAEQVRGQNGRGRRNFNNRGRTQYQPLPGNYSNAPHNPPQTMSQNWGQPPVANSTDTNSFPPLGSRRPQASTNIHHQHVQQQAAQGQYQPQNNHPSLTHPPGGMSRSHQPRGRGGNSRGRGNQSFHNNTSHNYPNQHQVQSTDDYHRPAPAQRRLFTAGSQPPFNNIEQQRAFQRMIMDQSDFLNYLANQSLKNQLTTEEQQAKECFRKELEAIAQKVIAAARTDDMKFNPEHIQLKLYGSLGSGFAVAGSDMDLLLAFPQNEGPLGDIEIDSRRLFEKALLDAGIGARLLTNTRVPILRVCQKPTSELLQNLRDYRASWEESVDKPQPPAIDRGFGPLPRLNEIQLSSAVAAFADLDLDAHEIPLPASPVSEQAKLEFIGDCGIQCDINFSNFVALHNTRLLKTYGMCDPRVRQVGVFVKNWAKSRDINTPYRGTLSSYGYILMVLHYLMNVVTPPVLPNLQELAKQKDAWVGKTELELVEGFDVRFIRDMSEVQAILKDMPRNHESVGALLRGFFWYYADPRGFRWNQDVISVRSRGGQILKRTKGWTEAKRSDQNPQVRLRYLVAIEDPFELEHNVGRTVGHNGLVAIRDEFRRAWGIVEKIKFDNESRAWFWLTADQQTILGEELIAVVENRGDLLRKDQDFHRQKIRQMKLDLEAKEKALQDTADKEVESVEGGEMNGTFEKEPDDFAKESEPPLTSTLKLINNGESQVAKRQVRQSRRRVVSDSDVEDEKQATQQTELKVNPAQIDWDTPFDNTEIAINAEFVVPEWNGPVVGVRVEEFNMKEPERHDPDEHYQPGMNPRSTDATVPAPNDDNSDHVVIEWDRQSSGGKWLHRRDKLIRSRKWNGPKNRALKDLNEKFPYDPNMTVAELASKNKLLRLLYMNSHSPEQRLEQVKTSSQISCRFSAPHSSARAQTDRVPSPIMVGQDQAKVSRSVSSRSTGSKNKMKFHRMSRGTVTQRHFVQHDSLRTSQAGDTQSQLANSSITQADPTRHAPYPDPSTETPGHSCSNFSESLGAIYASSAASQPSLAIHHQITPPSATTTTTNEETTKLLKLLKLPSPPQPANTQLQSQPPPGSNTSLVPLTLYPHLPPHRRPRDEDPNIMPIPRSLDFQFDLRQLADLDIIRRGGNGCAREGEEFDIEEDYEFGGLGMMAAGGPSDAASIVSRKMNTPDQQTDSVNPWDAKGDVEGLLGELPRDGWDVTSRQE